MIVDWLFIDHESIVLAFKANEVILCKLAAPSRFYFTVYLDSPCLDMYFCLKSILYRIG